MKNVLILAAGNISNKLSFIKAYYASPALIPINTKPLILYHLEFYSKQECQVYLVINQRDSQYIEESVNLNEFDFEIIGVPDSHGVNDSLEFALGKVPPGRETIVNLVTSVPTDFPAANTVYFESNLTYNNNWSGVKITGQELSFVFKRDEQKYLSHAFTGIFNIRTDILQEIIRKVEQKSDLLEVIKLWYDLHQAHFEYCLSDWIDAGHELNYYRSKLLLISSRSFNAVSVNESGVLVKSSSNFKKLTDEANFISAIPAALAIYFPRIIDGYAYDSEKKRGSYSMEFYGYPSMAELQLYWDLKDEVWDRVFADLQKVLTQFKKEPYSIGEKAFNDFYTGKIALRVNDFWNSLPADFKYLVEQDLMINGVLCKSYNHIKESLFKRISSLYAEEDFCVAHGDFCFNNILYDVSHRLIKVIDPRGSFGDNCKGLYGDVKYDLAKMLHSAVGGYDYLVNNLYKLDLHGEVINYRILFKSNHHIINERSRQVITDLGYSFKDIMLIVGTLFISMTPLHSDSSSRQKVMFIHGLKIINENL
jgi:NDP-sugar pyrophosphorylase family protein